MAIVDEVRQINEQLASFLQTQSKYIQQNKSYIHDLNLELETFIDSLGDSNDLTKQQQDLHKQSIDQKKKEIETQKRLAHNHQRMENLQKELNEQLFNSTAAFDPAKFQALQDKISETQKAIDNNNKAINTSREKYIKTGNLLEQTRQNPLNQFFSKMSKQSKMMDGVTDAFKHVAGNTGEFGKAATILTKGIGGVSQAFSILRLGLVTVGTVVSAVAAVLGIAAVQAYNYLQTAKSVGESLGGVLEGIDYDSAMIEFTNTARSYHMDPKELAKVSMEYRQLINASGGLNRALQNSIAVVDSSLARYGYDVAATTREALKTQDMLSRTGISLGQVGDTSLRLQKQFDNLASMGIKDPNEILAQLLGSDMEVTLKRLRQDERDAFIENHVAMVNHSKSLNMTTEQAMSAAKALQKLGAEKPLERYKKAMRMQVFAGMIGMGSEGQQLQRDIISGKLTNQSQKIMTSMTNRMDQMMQKDFLSTIAPAEILGKLNLEDTFGSNSPFSTTLLKTIELTKDSYVTATGSLIDQAAKTEAYTKSLIDSMQDGTGAVRLLTWTLKQLPDMLRNPFKKTPQNEVDDLINQMASEQAQIDKDKLQLQSRPNDYTLKTQLATREKEYNQHATQLFEMNQKLINQNKAIEQGYSPDTKTISMSKNINMSEQMLAEQKNTANIQQSADNTTTLTGHAETTNTLMGTQVKNTENANDLLRQLVESNKQVVDLAQKQLVATTSSEADKAKFNTYLRKFGSAGLTAEYAHIG